MHDLKFSQKCSRSRSWKILLWGPARLESCFMCWYEYTSPHMPACTHKTLFLAVCQKLCSINSHWKHQKKCENIKYGMVLKMAWKELTYTKRTHGKKKKVENFVIRWHHLVCNVYGSGKYNCPESILLSCYVETTKAKNTPHKVRANILFLVPFNIKR
jgi:hypothetical protein